MAITHQIKRNKIKTQSTQNRPFSNCTLNYTINVLYKIRISNEMDFAVKIKMSHECRKLRFISFSQCSSSPFHVYFFEWGNIRSINN